MAGWCEWDKDKSQLVSVLGPTVSPPRREATVRIIEYATMATVGHMTFESTEPVQYLYARAWKWADGQGFDPDLCFVAVDHARMSA